MKAFETIFTIEKNISDFTILELYREISKEVLKDNYLPRAILDDVEFFTAKNK
jgi:glucuronate isomerase